MPIAWACNRGPNARCQQIASGAVHLHGRGNHVLRDGAATILNGNRSIAVDRVDVDAVGCSGVQERIGGRHCQRLRRNPVVVRRAGENRKGSAAADAESGNVRIVSIADIKIVAGVGGAAAVGLRNKKIATRSHQGATNNTNPVFGASISLTCNLSFVREVSKHQTMRRRYPLESKVTRKSSIILSRCARYPRQFCVRCCWA